MPDTDAVFKVVEDEEFDEISEAYDNYEITYRDYINRMSKLYSKYGVEPPKAKNPYQRITRINLALTEHTIDEDRYDKKLKRIIKDIQDEAKEEMKEQLYKKVMEL